MQTRTRNALFLAAAFAVISYGLVVLSSSRKPFPLKARAASAIPKDTMIVATADLEALRASLAFAPLLRGGREIPGLGKVRDLCGFDPLEALREAAVAIPSAGEPGAFGLAAIGPIDGDALLGCAAKVVEARGGRPQISTIDAFRTLRDASLVSSGGEMAVRRDGMLLLGAGSYLRTMIDAASGHAPSVYASEVHARLERQLGEAQIRLTMVLTPEQRAALLEELEENGAEDSAVGSVVALALGVRLGPRVAIDGTLACEAEEPCSRLTGKLRADLKGRIAPLDATLDSLAFHPEKPWISLRISLPSERAAAIAERLLATRATSHKGASVSPEPPEPSGPKAPDAGAARVDEIVKPEGERRSKKKSAE